MSSNREIVTVILYCGCRFPWRVGESPRRNDFILCRSCNTGVHVKEVVRDRAA